MGFVVTSLDATQMLAALTTDDTKWAGADIVRPTGYIDFWSVPVDVSLTVTAGDKTLNDVAIPNITGVTIKAARAMVQANVFYEISGADNSLTPLQYIQVDKAAAGYINAITLGVNAILITASAKAFNSWMFFGTHDISSKVSFNASTTFKWANGKAEATSIDIKQLQTGVRVYI